MNTQHTPGPWRVETLPNGNQTVLDAKGDYACIKTNARLIAAAPELLEALQACLERMDKVQSMTDYPLAWPRELARAAIAKATL